MNPPVTKEGQRRKNMNESSSNKLKDVERRIFLTLTFSYNDKYWATTTTTTNGVYLHLLTRRALTLTATVFLFSWLRAVNIQVLSKEENRPAWPKTQDNYTSVQYTLHEVLRSQVRNSPSFIASKVIVFFVSKHLYVALIRRRNILRWLTTTSCSYTLYQEGGYFSLIIQHEGHCLQEIEETLRSPADMRD